MENTQSKESKGGDDFWSKAEALLYLSLIHILQVPQQAPASGLVIRLHLKPGDIVPHCLIQKPEADALAQAVREMMEYDELELEKLGEEKIALFAVVSDSDPTFNFISAMMYSQMFNVLCNRALTVYHGRLPVHVTCLFDEFANQKIPNWEHLVSVIRSRNISAHIVLQTYSQLKGMYRDNAETIAGCCSSLLFLGGKEESSLKMVATMLGKETIDTYNTSDTRGTSRSYGLNYQKLGKDMP